MAINFRELTFSARSMTMALRRISPRNSTLICSRLSRPLQRMGAVCYEGPRGSAQAAYCRRGATNAAACLPPSADTVYQPRARCRRARDDILEDLRLVTDADDLASDVDRHIVACFGRQQMILLPAGATTN